MRVWLCRICRSSLSVSCRTRRLSKLISSRTFLVYYKQDPSHESFFCLGLERLELCLSLPLALSADCRNFLSESFLERVEFTILDYFRGVMRSCLAVMSILDTDFQCLRVVHERTCLPVFPFLPLRPFPCTFCVSSNPRSCCRSACDAWRYSSSQSERKMRSVTAPTCLTFWNTPPKKQNTSSESPFWWAILEEETKPPQSKSSLWNNSRATPSNCCFSEGADGLPARTVLCSWMRELPAPVPLRTVRILARQRRDWARSVIEQALLAMVLSDCSPGRLKLLCIILYYRGSCLSPLCSSPFRPLNSRPTRLYYFNYRPMQGSSLQVPPPVALGVSESRRQIDTRWVQVKFGSSFSPRSYFAACIQAGNVYLHGGFSAETGILREFYTTCLYDQPATWRLLEGKTKSTPPGALRNHTLSPYLSNLILVGGQRNVVENNAEIYRYDLLTNRWSICQCVDEKGKKFALALDSHAAIVYKNCLYLINGFDSISSNYFGSVVKICLDGVAEDKLTYQVIKFEGNRPSLRGNASCCLVGGTVYLFGGGSIDDSYGDLWSWQIEGNKWTELPKTQETIAWPDKRKGGTLVHHEPSGTLFLFGGIKKITKEQNDVMVYIIAKRRWIKIHSSTNELYDPSPTIKELAESPTVAEEKRKRDRNKAHTIGAGGFRLESPQRMHETSTNEFKRDSPVRHNATEVSTRDFKRKVSVVQEKKYRDFLNRKKKLLSNIESGASSLPIDKRRSHSPTSEAIIFSLNCMGEQPHNDRDTLDLPKVIFDQQKGHVIGKKPCARDGHAALLHEECMIILGGDRHMVAFNDAYMFRLNKGVEYLPHYQ